MFPQLVPTIHINEARLRFLDNRDKPTLSSSPASLTINATTSYLKKKEHQKRVKPEPSKIKNNTCRQFLEKTFSTQKIGVNSFRGLANYGQLGQTVDTLWSAYILVPAQRCVSSTHIILISNFIFYLIFLYYLFILSFYITFLYYLLYHYLISSLIYPGCLARDAAAALLW